MQTSNSPRRKVLVVDDDTSLRRAVAVNVEVGGYAVVEAVDGEDALAKLREQPDIDLVICDVVMPNMNGADLLEQARSIRPNLPFIMITGYSSHDLMTKSLLYGAYTVLPKPFDPRTLLAIVKRAISSPLVLIVDASEDAEPMAAALEKSLIANRVVTSAAAGADALREKLCDVLIVDVALPDLDALANASIRSGEIRVIGLIGGDLTTAPRLGGTGAFTYLRKPVAPDRLMQVVATARATP